ncbi:MAG: metallophosphoesterase [Erysipelotrichaceae bacterium]|nr:metallophosphoesterase [Erysipelotrichaceae bacterium]
MNYVISDIHGCYEEYISALKQIRFSSSDTMYVLGDVIDRGEGGLKVLNHMMMHDNIIPLVGNHEYMAMLLLKKLCTEIAEESVETTLTEDDLVSLDYWCNDGGNVTLRQFQKLDCYEQELLLEYFEEFRVAEEIKVNGHTYVLMHAGVSQDAVNKSIDQLRIEEVVFESTNVTYQNKTIVCGHTPTNSSQIEFKANLIRIDCGCIFGGQLGILCLDTLETFYIPYLKNAHS